MTLDIRDAPEKMQVLYDALCEAFGEPLTLKHDLDGTYGSHDRFYWPLFEYSRHDCPQICFLAYTTEVYSCRWIAWQRWCPPFESGWITHDKLDIDKFVEGWRAYKLRRGAK